MELYKSITLPSNNGSVLCADYIPNLNQYVIASSNLELGLYDESTCRLTKRLSTPSTQMCLTYHNMGLGSRSPLLFSAGVSGVIYGWEIESGKIKFSMGGAGANGRLSNNSHKDMILDLLKVT